MNHYLTCAFLLAACGETNPGATPEPLYPRAPPEVAEFAHDWPLPNYDYDNTRNAKSKIDSRNVAELRESWRYELEMTPGDELFVSVGIGTGMLIALKLN